MLKKFLSYLKNKKAPNSLQEYYPFNEHDYEADPTKDRPLEVSEFQDEAMDPETRSPEREVFDQRTAERAEEALRHPSETTEHSWMNPNREPM